jgi:exoribonuclease R
MTTPNDKSSRTLLQGIARRAMIARGLRPDFTPAAIAELDAIRAPAAATDATTRDLRHLLWCSIDNDDSRDLDQLSVAEFRPDGATRLLVAIADVTSVVRQGSAIDTDARQNTTSVYTAAQTFPMLPEKLSTNLTSLNLDADRLAIVIAMTFSADGLLASSEIFPATVRNRAKLAYNSVAAWLDGTAPMPTAISAVPGLADNIKLQHRVASQLAELRHQHGALSLETLQTRPVFDGAILTGLEVDTPNSAKRLIEDLMIASNGVTARYLAAKQFPSIRRVVRVPKFWNRIVELAAEHGSALPKAPEPKRSNHFLVAAKAANPAGFPELSLSVIKLLGAGEYDLELPGAPVAGHFGLAVRDYSHSTAPNRRFPDVITQRLLKAAMAGPPAAIYQRRTGRVGETLHGTGGRRQESGTAGREVRRRDAALFQHRPAVRRHRHWGDRQRDVGSSFAATCRGKTGQWSRRTSSRQPPARSAREHRRGARLHRLHWNCPTCRGKAWELSRAQTCRSWMGANKTPYRGRRIGCILNEWSHHKIPRRLPLPARRPWRPPTRRHLTGNLRRNRPRTRFAIMPIISMFSTVR